MKQFYAVVLLAAFFGIACFAIGGCGENSQQSKDKEFFTSGNREADQRADQRMAQQEQLTGNTNNAGTTSTKSQAVLSTEKKPLYDRLGGEVGINLIVEDFVTRALADPRVNLRRTGIKRGGMNLLHRGDSMEWTASTDNIKLLKMYMAQFTALSTGGPTTYRGEDVKSAVKNMQFSNPEFDAALGDLKASLDKLQIANQEQKELLAVIETLRDQVVEER